MDALGTLFSFDGRVGRKTYWLTALALGLVVGIFALVHEVAGGVAGIATFVPLLANQVKRWHDRDKSGWWVLINLAPIIGGLWSFIELGFLTGTDGPNRFGAPEGAQARPSTSY